MQRRGKARVRGIKKRFLGVVMSHWWRHRVSNGKSVLWVRFRYIDKGEAHYITSTVWLGTESEIAAAHKKMWAIGWRGQPMRCYNNGELNLRGQQAWLVLRKARKDPEYRCTEFYPVSKRQRDLLDEKSDELDSRIAEIAHRAAIQKSKQKPQENTDDEWLPI